MPLKSATGLKVQVPSLLLVMVPALEPLVWVATRLLPTTDKASFSTSEKPCSRSWTLMR